MAEKAKNYIFSFVNDKYKNIALNENDLENYKNKFNKAFSSKTPKGSKVIPIFENYSNQIKTEREYIEHEEDILQK